MQGTGVQVKQIGCRSAAVLLLCLTIGLLIAERSVAAANFNLGMVELLKGLVVFPASKNFLDRAAHRFGTAETRSGLDPKIENWRTVISAATGNLDPARQKAVRTSYKDGYGAVVKAALASQVWQAGEEDLALELWLQAGYVQPAIHRAEKYLANTPQHNWSAAKRLYQRVLDQDPQNVVARRFLTYASYVNYDTGKLRKSGPEIESLLVQQPPTSVAMEQFLRHLWLERRFEDGVFWYEKSRPLFQDDPRIGVVGADLLLGSGRADEAVALLQRIAIAAPTADSVLALHHLCLAYWQMGHAVEATAACRKAVELDPGLIWAYEPLAGLLLAAGEPTEAEAYLLHAVTLQTGDMDLSVRLRMLLAESYVRTGECELADDTYEQARGLSLDLAQNAAARRGWDSLRRACP